MMVLMDELMAAIDDEGSLLLSAYELDFEDGGVNYHHQRVHDLEIELADPDSPDLMDQITAYLVKHIGPPGS
jgi:hypothetical protein